MKVKISGLLILSVLLFALGCENGKKQNKNQLKIDDSQIVEQVSANEAREIYLKKPKPIRQFPFGETNYQGPVDKMETKHHFVIKGSKDIEEIHVVENDTRSLKFPNDLRVLVQEFYGKDFKDHKDDFDFIVLFTTFQDRNSPGLAFHVGVQNDVKGISKPVFNSGFQWGFSKGTKLQSLLHMKDLSFYKRFGSLTKHSNFLYPVFGQELTHRWLAHLRRCNSGGMRVADMLGRDNAHWTPLLHSQASVQDGVSWKDNGNGTFTVLNNMQTFGDLDLYAMGMIESTEIKDFFLINNASTSRGQTISPLTPVTYFRSGTTIKGTKVTIKADDITCGNGKRVPDVNNSPKNFRAALILITGPGENITANSQIIKDLTGVRKNLEVVWKKYTRNKSTLCTRLSASCLDEELKFSELKSKGEAVPGKEIEFEVKVKNIGVKDAKNLKLKFDSQHGIDAQEQSMGDLEKTKESTKTIKLKIPEAAVCGKKIKLNFKVESEKTKVNRSIEIDVGKKLSWQGTEKEGLAWKNGDKDTASAGSWEYAKAKDYNLRNLNGRNIQTQYSSGNDLILVTDAEGNGAGGNDVDNGFTTFLSPKIDLSKAKDPILNFDMWFLAFDAYAYGYIGRTANGDKFKAMISDDDGKTWKNIIETENSTPDYMPIRLNLKNHIKLSDEVRLKFYAEDKSPANILEASIKNLAIFEFYPECKSIDPKYKKDDLGTRWVIPTKSKEIVNSRSVCKPCSASSQCGTNGVCVTSSNGSERYCSGFCTVGRKDECPKEYTCTALPRRQVLGVCTPDKKWCYKEPEEPKDGTCKIDKDCLEGQICELGICIAEINLVANAGEDQEIKLGESADLDGTGSTEDAIILWTILKSPEDKKEETSDKKEEKGSDEKSEDKKDSKKEEPKKGIIEDPTVLKTKITPTLAGEYEIQLMVQKGSKQATDLMILKVKGSPKTDGKEGAGVKIKENAGCSCHLASEKPNFSNLIFGLLLFLGMLLFKRKLSFN